jgi:hypothetical protein
MKEIKVTNGTFVIDEQDWDLIKDYRWYIQKDRNRVIAPYRSKTDPSVVQLPRMLMNAPKNMVVDHLDGNPLNNQRSNLRVVPQKQNTWNRKNVKKSEIPYRGVRKRGRGFEAMISAHRCSVYLGLFPNDQLAAAAYDKAAYILYGSMYVRPNLSQSLSVDILNEKLLIALRDS